MARAGRADGITKCDRPAVDIDLFAVETEILNTFLGESGRLSASRKVSNNAYSSLYSETGGSIGHERRSAKALRNGSRPRCGAVIRTAIHQWSSDPSPIKPSSTPVELLSLQSRLRLLIGTDGAKSGG